MTRIFFSTIKNSSVFNNVTLHIIFTFVGLSCAFGQTEKETDTLKNSPIDTEIDFSDMVIDTTGMATKTILKEPEFMSLGPDFEQDTLTPSFWGTYINNPMQLGLKYEMAYKFSNPDRVQNNRFSLHLKYSKLLFNSFTLQIDSKLFAFLKNDHRSRNLKYWYNDNLNETAISFGGRTKDIYLQTSFYQTSIRAGIQTIAWGESDFATVIDEISPLDLREPLSLNIDEFRLGQAMITIDQYSSIGRWSAFFTPFPLLNEHPKEGTGYYFDPFNGEVEYQKEKQNGNYFEYGIRWKKTFGKSDVSLMAASLINNEYAIRMDSQGILNQSKYRYSMAGLTFNYALNSFLFRGEAAFKSPKKYNDASLQILEKKNFDALLGVDYSLSSSLLISMEAANYHIIDWDENISGVSKNNYFLLFVLSKQFFNNDFSVNWATMYTGPNSSTFNLLTSSYNWNDNTTLYFDLLLPQTKNEEGNLWLLRDQQQIALKINYQF